MGHAHGTGELDLFQLQRRARGAAPPSFEPKQLRYPENAVLASAECGRTDLAFNGANVRDGHPNRLTLEAGALEPFEALPQVNWPVHSHGLPTTLNMGLVGDDEFRPDTLA